MFPIDKNKNFKSDLSIIVDKLRNREKFSFSKYADGEMAILVDSQITNCDGWTFKPDEHKFYRNKLIESFQYSGKNYYIGIGCRCCMGDEYFNWMKDNCYKEENMISIDEKLEYPIFIEVSEDYWISSEDVEYVESN